MYLVSFDSPNRDESNGTKYSVIGRVSLKIFMVISFGYLGGLVHVIPTLRPRIKAFSTHYSAYTRNFEMKKIALNSPR